MVDAPAPPPPPKPKPLLRVVEVDPAAVPIEGTGRFTPWGKPKPKRVPSPGAPVKRGKRGAIVLKAVRPNVGFEVRYRKLILALVGEMHRDVQTTLQAAYVAGTAHDASPASYLQGVMRRLSRRWSSRFDQGAQDLAAYFAKGVHERSDAQLAAILKRAGFAIPFRLTPAIRDQVEAAVAENVTLIKSIASQYLTQVEGHVMRSVSVGRDLAPLARALEHQYGVTRRRAALIARDQNNKATAVIVRERQNELGIKAIWLHSGGGKEPRPTHVANSGKEYDPVEGWYDPAVRERIWPGTLINCRCVSRSVIPGLT